MKKKRVLITGASGFIGANLVRRLLKLNYEIHICTRHKSNKWRLHDVARYVNEHQVNFALPSKLEKTIRRINPQIIYHLAAFGGYPFQKDLTTMIDTNITGTANLLNALQSTDYDLFVYFGSSSEYGFKKKPMKETDRLEPASFYAATKAGATHICQAFAKLYQKPIVAVRPFSVYGPYEEPTRLIPTAITKLLKNADLHLTPGSECRDFLYIDDFIDGLVLLQKQKKHLAGQVINLGSGLQHATSEVVEIIYQLTKSRSKLLWDSYPNRAWDTNYWLADISLAQKKLGWKPKHSLRQGLAATVDWFKKNLEYYKKIEESM